MSVSAPAWLGIGAQRSGTTWFTDLLTQHPQVGLGTNGKKEQHLLHKVADGRAAGRRTTSTCSRPTAYAGGSGRRSTSATPRRPAAAARLVPDAPVLVLLRDPVERFRSAMRLRRHPARPPGNPSPWPYPVPITMQTFTGFYADQLAAWARRRRPGADGGDGLRAGPPGARRPPSTTSGAGSAWTRCRCAGVDEASGSSSRADWDWPDGLAGVAAGDVPRRRSPASSPTGARRSRLDLDLAAESVVASGHPGAGPTAVQVQARRGRTGPRAAGTGRARGARRPARACAWRGSRPPSRPAPRRAPTSPRTTPGAIVTESSPPLDVDEPGLVEQPRQVALVRAGRRVGLAARAGSSSGAHSQNSDSGPRPPPWSHTQAATGPPGRVTRAISARPRAGSFMKCTTSWA